MYYCLHCGKLHHVTREPDEMVFETGFVFIEDVKHPAGTCRTINDDIEESL